MPTANPRVNVVFEKPLYKDLRRLASRHGVSLSTEVRDMVRDTMKKYGDSYLWRTGKTSRRGTLALSVRAWKPRPT
jgi:hypothetical protein